MTDTTNRFHEAGHAVMAELLGFEPVLVSVQAMERTFGRCRHVVKNLRLPPDAIDGGLLVLAAAGWTAARLRCGVPMGEGAVRDFRFYIASNPGAPLALHDRWSWLRIGSMLAEPELLCAWKSVEAVAEALKGGDLDREAIVALVDRKAADDMRQAAQGMLSAAGYDATVLPWLLNHAGLKGGGVRSAWEAPTA